MTGLPLDGGNEGFELGHGHGLAGWIAFSRRESEKRVVGEVGLCREREEKVVSGELQCKARTTTYSSLQPATKGSPQRRMSRRTIEMGSLELGSWGQRASVQEDIGTQSSGL